MGELTAVSISPPTESGLSCRQALKLQSSTPGLQLSGACTRNAIKSSLIDQWLKHGIKLNTAVSGSAGNDSVPAVFGLVMKTTIFFFFTPTRDKRKQGLIKNRCRDFV